MNALKIMSVGERNKRAGRRSPFCFFFIPENGFFSKLSFDTSSVSLLISAFLLNDFYRGFSDIFDFTAASFKACLTSILPRVALSIASATL